MNLMRSTWPIVLVLAGCAVSIATPPSSPVTAAKVAKAKAPAKAEPSETPSQAPSAQAPLAAPKASPPSLAAPVAKPPLSTLKIPTRVLPDLPASLVAAGAGNLVGPDGASLIGADGGTLIGMDGASLVGMDGASYALAQAATPSPAATPSAEPTCGPPEIPLAPGMLIKMEFQNFIQTCRDIEHLLADAAALGLEPGVPKTETSKGMSGQDEPLTFLLEQRDDGGLLKVGRGTTVTKDNFMVALAFSSADQGEVVYRIEFEQFGLVMGARVRFDQAKGTVSSDVASKFAFMGAPPMVFRRQVAVTKLPGGGPDAPTLRLVVGTAEQPGRPRGCAENRTALAIHYLPDDRAAIQVAKANVAGAPLVYLGLDGVRAPAIGPGTGFFVDKDGTYLAGDVTLTQLGAALPSMEHMPASLPPLPDVANPLADPVFEPIW